MTGSRLKWARVNQDSIAGPGKAGTRHQCVEAARTALQADTSVIVDRCNPNPKQREDFCRLAGELGVQAHCVVLDLPHKTCVERVLRRTAHEGGFQGVEHAKHVGAMHRLLTAAGPPGPKEGMRSVITCRNPAEAAVALSVWKGWDGRADPGAEWLARRPPPPADCGFEFSAFSRSAAGRALVSAARDPTRATGTDVIFHDELCVGVLDKYPKARAHALVLAREPDLLSVHDLRQRHVSLLRHMLERARGWSAARAAEDPSLPAFRCGFHALPSMPQLHLHVISQDFDSPCLKTKQHYNSFTTPFFLDAERWVIPRLQAGGRLSAQDLRGAAEHIRRPLACHRVLGWVLSRVARSKHVRLSLGSIYFFGIEDLKLSLLKGPIPLTVRIGKIVLWPADATSETGVLSLLTGGLPRIPLLLRDVRVLLEAGQCTDRPDRSAPGTDAPPKPQPGGGGRGALSRAVSLLQFLAIHVEDLTISDAGKPVLSWAAAAVGVERGAPAPALPTQAVAALRPPRDAGVGRSCSQPGLFADEGPGAAPVPRTKAWLAVHGPLLAGAATQRQLWDSATAAPFVALDSLAVSGPMLLAKQATAKPETRPRPWQCGAHAATILDVSVKGTKAPVKVYTDALLQGSGLQILHGPGMEPALAMMALAGKRLAPSDPDKSLPRPPPIPWWDDLRYMWRGRAGLEVAGLRLTLAADRRAGPGPDSARLVLAAHRVGAELAEGVAELRLAGLAVDAFEAVGLDGPAGGLLRLPMLAVPALTLRLEAGWRLPGGRTPRQHHLFPPTPPLDGVQGPRLPGELYKSEALDLGITADLGGSAAQSAVVYLGDHQIQFLRTWIALLRMPDPAVRAVVRRGTFFVRKPKGLPPKKNLPKLLREMKIQVSASPLEIVHFTCDATDPSHNVCISAVGVEFGASWLFNQPIPSFLKPPPHAAKRPPPTRTISRDFLVTARDVGVRRGGDPAPPGDGKAALEGLGGSPDAKLLIDGAARDALWGAIEHLSAAQTPAASMASPGSWASPCPGSSLPRRSAAGGAPMTTPLDDANAKLRYSVEVVNLQINLEAQQAQGRFLLAAESGLLEGLTLPHNTMSITKLTLDQVQAYVSATSVDPGATPAWLDTHGGRFAPGAEPSLRRVFNPIHIGLRHSRVTPGAHAGGGGAASAPSRVTPGPRCGEGGAHRRTSTAPGWGPASFTGAGPRGEELLLSVPQIVATMEGTEFEVLVEVVEMLLSQGPGVDTVGEEGSLLAADCAGDEVEDARQSYALLRRELAEARALTVEGLLLCWAEEQEERAATTLEAARSSLQDLKAEARKRQQNRFASRLRLQVDRVVWQLCSPGREPFVQASIRRLCLDRLRNRDHSGSFKFVIHRIEVLDALGTLEPAPGVGAGVILSVWNPDASWARDDVLRLVATLGVPTKARRGGDGEGGGGNHTVYEHVDASLHPLAVHLTESIAVAFWEYFFPKEPDAAKRQAAFAQSFKPAPSRKGHRRARTALPSEAEGGSLAGELSHGEGSGSFTPPPLGACATPRSAPSKLHRRGTSEGQGSLSRQGSASHDLTISPENSVGGAGSPLFGSGGRRGVRQASMSAVVRTSRRYLRRMGGVGGEGSKSARRPSTAAARKPRFKHFRTNRMHCRVTYAGYPLTFTDLKLVLDNRTYENFEGGWRDLLARIKWDTVKSVAKSVTGLQGRKFKELLSDSAAEVEVPAKQKTGSHGKGLLASLGLGKSKHSRQSSGSESGSSTVPLTGEQAQTAHKARMLFGGTHALSRPHPPATAASSSSQHAQRGHTPDASPQRGGVPRSPPSTQRSAGSLGGGMEPEPLSSATHSDEHTAEALLGTGGQPQGWVQKVAQRAQHGAARLRESI
ncbi:Aprataxin [Auxenochlorella protothecoides]|uniref:Aprataxin n=1 Tax=Auxenochlorella protothecoides TaxID=3075 RepID=A0A087SIU5_AUXPR|nr:Aprataxin [Auxenochlorella protothecoides]KFM25649.1 Aprataxin [Auxenochlorella protothecoides]